MHLSEAAKPSLPSILQTCGFEAFLFSRMNQPVRSCRIEKELRKAESSTSDCRVQTTLAGRHYHNRIPSAQRPSFVSATSQLRKRIRTEAWDSRLEGEALHQQIQNELTKIAEEHGKQPPVDHDSRHCMNAVRFLHVRWQGKILRANLDKFKAGRADLLKRMRMESWREKAHAALIGAGPSQQSNRGHKALEKQVEKCVAQMLHADYDEEVAALFEICRAPSSVIIPASDASETAAPVVPVAKEYPAAKWFPGLGSSEGRNLLSKDGSPAAAACRFRCRLCSWSGDSLQEQKEHFKSCRGQLPEEASASAKAGINETTDCADDDCSSAEEQEGFESYRQTLLAALQQAWPQAIPPEEVRHALGRYRAACLDLQDEVCNVCARRCCGSNISKLNMAALPRKLQVAQHLCFP